MRKQAQREGDTSRPTWAVWKLTATNVPEARLKVGSKVLAADVYKAAEALELPPGDYELLNCTTGEAYAYVHGGTVIDPHSDSCLPSGYAVRP